MFAFLKKSFVAVALLLAVSTVNSAENSARAATLTFDDITATGSTVPYGYGGLNWVSIGKINAAAYTNPNGYVYGMVSPSYVIFNNNGQEGQFNSLTPFTFNSAYFTAAWNNGLTVTVTGFVGSVQTYVKNFVIDSTAPSLQTFNWQNLSSVTYVGSGGTSAGYTGGLGTQVAIDNLTINDPVPSGAVPEPGTWAMLLCGFGLMGAALRRKHKAHAALA